TFTGLNNGYGVTQFYYGAVYPTDDAYFGGTQDNGTPRGSDGGPNAWTSINDGDGGAVAIDPTNTNVLFSENTGLSIQKCAFGAACTSNDFVRVTTGISGDNGFQFIAPFIMDPSQPHRLWTGGTYMWRTVNQAANWQRASAALSSGVSAIAAAPADGNYVLAGTENGAIHRTTIGLSSTSTTAWASVTPRSGYVSSVAFDPYDPTTAYATYATFGTGTGIGHVYKSTNAGGSWSLLDGTGPLTNKIPDIPAHTIVVDPTDTQRLYVGTD